MGSKDEDGDNDSPKAGAYGSQADKPNGPEGKKDEFESDATKSTLFGIPTLSPTTKTVLVLRLSKIMLWSKVDLTTGDNIDGL